MKRRLKKGLMAQIKADRQALLDNQPEELTRLDIANNIKAIVSFYYRAKKRAVFFELGLVRKGRLRADVVALAMNGHVVLVEVKSSVADFRADNKHKKYLPLSNQAYFAMPRKVYKKVKDDIDPSFGVFICEDDGLKIEKVVGAKSRQLDLGVSSSLAIRAAFRSSDHSNRKNKIQL
jgi:hypothetical protein